MTINDLTEELGIDLSLTGGNGLYLGSGKEKMWPERKVVVVYKETGDRQLSVNCLYSMLIVVVLMHT